MPYSPMFSQSLMRQGEIADQQKSSKSRSTTVSRKRRSSYSQPTISSTRKSIRPFMDPIDSQDSTLASVRIRPGHQIKRPALVDAGNLNQVGIPKVPRVSDKGGKHTKGEAAVLGVPGAVETNHFISAVEISQSPIMPSTVTECDLPRASASSPHRDHHNASDLHLSSEDGPETLTSAAQLHSTSNPEQSTLSPSESRETSRLMSLPDDMRRSENREWFRRGREQLRNE